MAGLAEPKMAGTNGSMSNGMLQTALNLHSDRQVGMASRGLPFPSHRQRGLPCLRSLKLNLIGCIKTPARIRFWMPWPGGMNLRGLFLGTLLMAV